MFDFVTRPFDPSGFPARWSCGTWTEAHGWTYVLSDVAIFGAYLAIPVLIVLFLRGRKDLPFPKVGWLFVGFILFCGATHLIDAIIFWNPIYRLAAVMRFLTAVVSWATVFALIPTIPAAMTFRSPADLQREVEARTKELSEEREENARLAQMVRSAADAIVATDLDGRVLHANTAARLLYGHDVARRIRSEDLGDYDRLLRMVCRGERVSDVEVLRQTPAGELRVVSLTLSPLYASNGEVVGVTEIGRDLTERRQSERLFQATVEAAPSAMLLVNEQGRVVLTNGRATEVFGVEQEQLVGGTLEGLLPALKDVQLGELSQSELSSLAQSLKSGKGLSRLDIPVQVGLTAVTQNKQQYVLAAVSDVTEREAHAQALLEAHESLERKVAERTLALKQSNQDLEQFAYVVSHDLAEPLRMVASFTELLLEQAEQLDEDGRTFLSFAHDGAKRMQVLLADLLRYSRVGRGPLEAVTASLDRALDMALENLMLRVEESGAQVTRSPDPLPSVQGDLVQLTQLLQNLISNAIKFSGDSPPRVHVSVIEDKHALTLNVMDQGVGFDPGQGERIFEIFQRLHREQIPGTGVGLAICRRIAERHQGQISAQSIPGSGTTFEVIFPKIWRGA